MQRQFKHKQHGVSLVGLIFVLGIVAVLAILGMKIVPTVSEFNAVKTAIAKAKNDGTTPAEIRNSFDKQADVGYITAITGKDLEIFKGESGTEISFAYDKKIPLVGPASLLIEYAGSTEKSRKPAKDGGA